eukprot:368236-Prorocentrum_minimum.AAC.1
MRRPFLDGCCKSPCHQSSRDGRINGGLISRHCNKAREESRGECMTAWSHMQGPGGSSYRPQASQ